MVDKYSYKLYFCFCFSIDATESNRLGKFVNDAPPRYANCVAKTMMVLGQPHVILFASRDIPAGSEIDYNYGGGNLPWRKVIATCSIFVVLACKLTTGNMNFLDIFLFLLPGIDVDVCQ